MDLLKCLGPQRIFQAIFLMMTFNHEELKIKPSQYTTYVPKFALICTLFYLDTQQEKKDYPIFLAFMNTTNRSLEILVPLIVYLTDFLVETKMIDVVKTLLAIDRKFGRPLRRRNVGGFVKKIVVAVAILCIIECLINFLGFDNAPDISTILINVVVCRWIIYLYISGGYLEDLATKIKPEVHLLETVKTTRLFHNDLYFLFKKIEAALSLNIFLAVVFGYFKVLWNFFKVVKYMNEGVWIYSFLNGVMHLFPLLGTILPCMWVQRKAQTLRLHLTKKYDDFPRLQKEIYTLSLQVLHQEIVFTPLQAFALNSSLIMAIIGSFVTYLVILLQLQVV